MIQFPNCKINLGLNVLEKRADGFHNIASVFYPIPLHDVLELVPATDGTTRLFNYGLAVNGPETENLCFKAYQLIKAKYPQTPAVHIHLYKNIPMGAGLGGGSANGAFMLMALNKKYNLNIAEADLLNMALALGSDCPFFIKNQPVLASGRGEILSPVHVDLSAYHFLIVNPGIHINTGWAFAQLQPQKPSLNIADLIEQPVAHWKDRLVNDFEAAVFKQHPVIAQLKELLYSKGAVYAAMTGSGSTVFGLFTSPVKPSLDLPAAYKTFFYD